MKTFICAQPQTLRDFTDCTYPQGSFCFAQLLRARDIKVNGARVNSNVSLKEGDEVVYYTSARQENAPSHTDIYEDGNLLVADKFSGVSSEGLCSELNTYGVYYPVHRLDRNTCGLILFAKSKEAEKELLRVFKDRDVQKTYMAVCRDGFKEPEKTLTAYMKKDSKEALVKVFASPGRGLQKIITGYKVLQKGGGLALVEVRLYTGKTHQIRAHMSYMGCPVLGDNKYGDEALNRRYGLSRQCLISKRIEFSALSGCFEYLNGMAFQSSFSFDLSEIRPANK